MTGSADRLRTDAGALADPLPPLLAQATRLAATVVLGEHGRRRVGQGDEFWQYRPAHEGDEARQIDWRRSARSDLMFMRQKEWQSAQSVLLWVDGAPAMAFSSRKDLPEKMTRARVLVLALAVVLLRGGERIGVLGDIAAPRAGLHQFVPLAHALLRDQSQQDYGAPDSIGLRHAKHAVMVSDFLGDMGRIEETLGRAAARGIDGILLQILDPQEEAFPFEGRTIFQSIGGTLHHETQAAGDLRLRYLDRLAARKAALRDLARRVGWRYECHHTDTSASAALLWLYSALEGGR